eukprot:9010666-Alexandrium_andersonii.AAC.1
MCTAATVAAVWTRGPASAALSCCTCGGAEPHMRWPGCASAGAPPNRVSLGQRLTYNSKRRTALLAVCSSFQAAS